MKYLDWRRCDRDGLWLGSAIQSRGHITRPFRPNLLRIERRGSKTSWVGWAGETAQGHRQLTKFGSDVDFLGIFGSHFQRDSSAKITISSRSFRISRVDRQYTNVRDDRFANRTTSQWCFEALEILSEND